MQRLKVFVTLLLMSFLVMSLSAGCNKGRETADRMTAEEAEAKGLVPDGKGGFMHPGSSNSEGYGTSDDSAYDDEDEADGSSDEDYDDDEDMDDEDADSDVASSDNGYGGGEGYGDGYGSPYGNADPTFYTENVVPILRAKCYNCHGGGPRGMKGDIALHSPNAFREADVLVAGDPESSELFIRVTMEQGDSERMPPRGPGLTKDELATIETWIKQGATFGNAPDDADPFEGAGQDTGSGYGEGYGEGYGNPDGGGRGGDGYGEDNEDEPRRRAPPKNLAEFASRSFQAGKDQVAMRQLHAQALVRSDAGKSVLEKYRWVPKLKRASLAVRWGIGIKYKAKHGFSGAPRPVGVVQDLPGDDHDNVDESDEGAFGDFSNSTLDYYTGDIGKELLLRLQNRIDRGDYGEILHDEVAAAVSGPDEDDWDDEDNGGYGRGSGGSGYGGGGYGGGASGDNDSDKPDGKRIEQIMPGVTMVGEAATAELLDRANKEGIDVLVVLDIITDPNNRLKIADTSTRVRFYDVQTKDQVAISGKINNIAIQRELAENGEDETIVKEMDKVFATIDTAYRAKPFPSIKSDKARKSVIGFVRNALSHPSNDPLWKLSEVRFYESQGALKPEHADAAFKKILPSQAAKLKNVVDENEIRTLLAEWINVGVEIEDEASEDEDDNERKRPERTFR